MAEVLGFALLAAVAAVWQFLLTHKLKRENLELRARQDGFERMVASLTQRVWNLEHPASVPLEMKPPVPGTVASTQPGPVPKPASVLPEQPSPPGEDWETLVGTNWLNRLGALVLVIGIALFLGYSVTQLGPAGKLAIGAATGLSLLAGGIALERYNAYRRFSFSLMAAGWAVLYFTAYASHAVPAARVIGNPVYAMMLLLLVSAGMIGHALRYGSEAAAALAFVFGFAGLNVSPLTSFSILATLILALSLLWVGHRFEWHRLALLAAALVYTTFVISFDAGVYSRSGILSGQATVWIYWLTFEVYDLLELRRRGQSRGIERTLFLINGVGFLGASWLQESSMPGGYWALYLALASLAYLVSTFLRASWAQPGEGRYPAAEGGFEASATFAALFMAGAVVEKFDGTSVSLALLMEAELLLLASAFVQSKYLRILGTATLALPFIHLVFVDCFAEPARPSFAGLKHWTPVAAGMAAVSGFNRWLFRDGWYFAAAAAVLLGIISVAELPRADLAPVTAASGLGLILMRRGDLRAIGAVSLMAGFATALVINAPQEKIVTTMIVVAALYASQFVWPDRSTPVRAVFSVTGSVLLTELNYETSPARFFTVACGAEAAIILAAGFILRERMFRLTGLVLFLLCLGRLFLYDLRTLDTVSRILSFVVLGVVLMLASWVYTRYRDKLSRLL